MSVGINGFGRIGRSVFRQLIEKGVHVDFISDSNLSIDQAEILANYDSVYGKSKKFIKKVSASSFEISKKKIKFYKTNSLSSIDFNDISIFIDCTPEPNIKLIKDLMKKNKNVRNSLITHHTLDADQFFVYGVNSKKLPAKRTIVSTTSCDGTAISPILKEFLSEGINFVSIIAMHPYLSSQRLLDGGGQESKDSNLSLWRAAPNNLIPKETSIAKVCSEILPAIEGKIEAYQIRVPTNCVSGAFVRIFFDKNIEVDKVHSKIDNFKKSNFVMVNSVDLTSIDFRGEPFSCIIDKRHIVIKDKFLELLIWYDNEYGYASRVVDLVSRLI